jgi:hypothetical protein
MAGEAPAASSVFAMMSMLTNCRPRKSQCSQNEQSGGGGGGIGGASEPQFDRPSHRCNLTLVMHCTRGLAARQAAKAAAVPEGEVLVIS